MKKTILLFFISYLILSCSTTKTTSKEESIEKMRANDLEQFLTLNNNYIKIPITKMRSGHLHVNAIVNGVQGEFLLDTGAGATVIDPKRKAKFLLETKKTNATGSGAGGKTNLQKSPNNIIKIGDLEKQKFAIYIMDLDHVNAALTSMGIKEIDGVIGADILTSNKGIIDYSELTLYLKK